MIIGGYEWDDAKAASNLVKHGISFRLAMQVFEDPQIIHIHDHRQEYGEERWNAIGIVGGIAVIICVCYTERERIRIISARPASRRERLTYAHHDS